MADDNYIAAIKGLLEELRLITIQAMAESGVPKSSDLSKSVKYYVTRDGIKMMVAEYYPYVDAGRSGTKRRAGLRRIPLDALIQWIKKNGILGRNKKSGRFITINQTAWAIQTAIYKRGINSSKPVKGKQFAQKVADNVADYTSEELVNYLAMMVADDLVEAFAPVAN